MTLAPSLHKERVDFSHNYAKIRIKCPECIRTVKGSNHVRVYDNIPGLWRHIKQEHGEISNLQLTTDVIKEVLKNIALAIEWRMLPDYDKVTDTTTSLSILFKGRSPRADVKIKLQKIAYLLKIQSGIYPIYTQKSLFTLVEKALGNVDSRTFKDYIECVVSTSKRDKVHGTYDVTNFCEQF